MPILPMVLVNGAEGIGTGWSTYIPNYNPRDIVANLRHLMAGEEPEAMQPWYRGFQGSIVEVPTKTSGRSYQCSGIISQVRRACCRSCWAALASLPWVAAQGHDHSCSGSHTLH
jgi:DNA topoisomerase-2